MKLFQSIAKRFTRRPPPAPVPSPQRVPIPTHASNLNLTQHTEEDSQRNKYEGEIEDAFAQLTELAAQAPPPPVETPQSLHELDQEIQQLLAQHPDNVPHLISVAGQKFEQGATTFAATLFESIAKTHDDPTAAYSYGMCLQQGHGVPQPDAKRAVGMFAKAARRGHPWAQYALAQAFHSGSGVAEDHAEALQLFQVAAQNGIPPASFNVANMYAAGQGTSINEPAAVEWYGRAAELGDPKAQFALGSRHCSGRGVVEDWDVGYTYHANAAEQGYAPAQFNVGTHYFTGQGVEQNFPMAAKWFEKASEQGLSQASFNLGQMHFNGNGVEESYEKGVACMETASALGNTDAEQILMAMAKEREGKGEELLEGAPVEGANVGEVEQEKKESISSSAQK